MTNKPTKKEIEQLVKFSRTVWSGLIMLLFVNGYVFALATLRLLAGWILR